ncbi:hypothetical protein [Mycoplasma sp. 1932B]|uniref:hypothetical protein n=1 Tax=unclassified Mycoplasma TaxID=2683645 RepID=UPI003AABC6AD
MKKNKKISTLICLSSIAAITVATTLSASLEKDVKINKNNKLKKINVSANNFDNDNEKFEFSSNSYSYKSSSRYTMVVAYDNINPVNDKNGFLWYLANKKDISKKYWDFLMYCTKNLKNQDILNLNAMFSYHIYNQYRLYWC